jgi:hypothetical protein
VTYTLAFLLTATGLLGFSLSSSCVWRVTCAAAALINLAMLMALALGYPLPWWAERGCMARAAEPELLGGSADEDAGKIFLTLQSPECGEPRLYWIPYSHKTAEALAQAQRESAERGTGVSIKRPFELSYDGLAPLPYAAPQPALPPKTEVP